VIFLSDIFFVSTEKIINNSEEQFIDQTLESSKEKTDYIEIAREIIKKEEKTVPVPKLKVLTTGTGTNLIIKKNKKEINF
jgi:hypothetical protein